MRLSVGVVLEILIAIFDHQRFVPQLYVGLCSCGSCVCVCVHKPLHKDSGLEAVAERIKCEDFIPEMEKFVNRSSERGEAGRGGVLSEFNCDVRGCDGSVDSNKSHFLCLHL